jgi:GH24 family phage-related lysozyme (muramidase)
VWTVCYGETKGVKPSDVYTKRQCDAMLKAEVASYRAAIFRHYTPETKASRLTPQRDAAFVSLGYNVGTAQVGRSTAMRRLNAGDIKGACVATTWYNRAGQRVIRGLVNRRAEEYSCCVYDLVPEEQRVCL